MERFVVLPLALLGIAVCGAGAAVPASRLPSPGSNSHPGLGVHQIEVLGFDGAPTSGVVLNGQDAAGSFIFDVRTDARGTVRIDPPARCRQLVAFLEGVRITREAPFPETLRFDFSQAPHDVLSGTVRGFDGRPIPDLTLFAMDGQGEWMATVTSDREGRWTVHHGRPVRLVRLDPDGWDVQRLGPWNPGTSVEFDLRKEPFFTLRGTVVDESGRPFIGAVLAQDGRRTNIHRTVSGGDGHFVLPCNRPVSRLWVQVDEMLVQIEGPWTADEIVHIDLRAAGVFVIDGQLRDAMGRPVAGADLFTSGLSRAGRLARTGPDGAFRFRHLGVLPGVVVVTDEARRSYPGPWDRDATLALTLAR